MANFRSRIACGFVLLAVMASAVASRADDDIFDFSKPEPAKPKPITKPPAPEPVTETPPASTTAPTASAKDSVPSPEQFMAASKQVDEVFGDDIAKAKTADQKLIVSEKILQAGISEKADLPAKYALLDRARALFVDAGDFEKASAAIDAVASAFTVDPDALKIDSATAISKSSQLDIAKFGQDMQAVIDSSMAGEDFDFAKRMNDLVGAAARRANSVAMISNSNALGKQIAETRAAGLEAKKAESVLQSKPNDPDANYRLGTYLCYFKSDWPAGLIHLQNSSNENARLAAEIELKHDANPYAQVQLAEAWWDLAEKETGTARNALRTHAGDIYERVLPNISGLAKVKASRRIKEAEASVLSRKNVINLLPMFNAITGNWRIEKGALLCTAPSDHARCELGYAPPEEYDFRVVFTRITGVGDMDLICFAARKPFAWVMAGWDNHYFGFAKVGDLTAKDNKTSSKVNSCITNGRDYECILKVRSTGAQAYLNGKLISEWKTDFTDIGTIESIFELPHPGTLGICTHNSTSVFKTIELTEITGKGKKIAEKKEE